MGNRELMRELGLATNNLPGISFFDEALPVPFSSDLGSMDRLQTNLATCMTLCRAESSSVFLVPLCVGVI